MCLQLGLLALENREKKDLEKAEMLLRKVIGIKDRFNSRDRSRCLPVLANVLGMGEGDYFE